MIVRRGRGEDWRETREAGDLNGCKTYGAGATPLGKLLAMTLRIQGPLVLGLLN